MSILNRRLLRSIKKNKLQFAAMVTIVLVGISMYTGLTGVYSSLHFSQQSFYAENRMSDHMFNVSGAPAEIIRRIETVPGVAVAEGRNQQDVKLATQDGSRAQVRLTGYNTDQNEALHYPYVVEGRYPDISAGGEALDVLADVAFFQTNGLTEGDEVYVIVAGKQVKLNVVGAAVSPEYIYTIKDASNLFPDPKGFGIVFIPEQQLASVLGRSGQVGQILVSWENGENQSSIDQIKEILSPYGLISDTARKDYPSHNMLTTEIDQLKVMATAFPMIFLIVAAMVEIIILRRTISAQRLSIGILKSQGFSNITIMMSFANYALFVTVIGTALGVIAGYFMGSALTSYYGVFFHLPYTLYNIEPTSNIASLVIGPLIGLGSGLMAAQKISHIQAAEAMRAEPPKSGKTVAIEEIKILWNRLNAQWRMAMRSVGRNMGRFMVVTLGMICTTALLLLSFYMYDMTNYMLDTYFKSDIKYDYIARFDNSIHKNDVSYFNSLPDVVQMEPFVEIAVTLSKGDKTVDEAFMGMVPGTVFKDIKDENQNIMQLPESGLIISNVAAKKIGASTGDDITLKIEPQPGVEKFITLPVMGIHEQLMGYKSLCSLDQAGSLMDEPGIVSGVMINVKDGHSDGIEKALDDVPKVASWSSKSKEENSVAEMMAILPSMVAIMVTLSLILGFAVLYNAGIISLAERRNEIATLRTIGFTVSEVRDLLFKETLVQSVIGYIAGLPIGYLMIKQYIGSMNSEMYTFPIIIHWQSYVYAAIPAFLLIFLTSRLTTRSLKKMDLVEVTRIRE